MTMDNPTPEAMDFANIRTTIRQIVFPLVQAIYDENPSDIILFCSGYFNSLLQKRESSLQNTNTSYSGERNQVEEELPKMIESKEIFPINLQESASDPVLTTNSRPESVNLAGRKRSSWDAPSNILEPPVVFLEEVECGIGDQPSLAESQMDLENDAKAGDADIHLKEDSVYEDESLSEYMIQNEIQHDSAGEDLKSPHCCRGNTPEDIKALCVQFENMQTEMPGTLKLDDSRREDFDQDTVQKKDSKICRKQLSPNSSFGFVPHLNEYYSEEEEKKRNSEDSHSENFKTKAEEISMIASKVSQNFHNLEERMSCAENNFNDMLQNAKEISDVIQRQNNVSETDSTNKSDEVPECRGDFIGEKKNGNISNISDKYDDVTEENKAHAKKTDDVPCTFKVDDRNMPAYLNPDEKEYKETKREYQKETSPNKEKSVNTACRNYDEDDREKLPESESQAVVDKVWRKRWYEAHPSLDNLNSSQRRDPRLFQAQFFPRKPNIGEGGDVPLDRIYIPNEASNDYMNNRSRNQISSESSTDAREFSYSRLSSDEISHRSNSARSSSDKLSERKSASEKLSNANPKRIPYSWRKSCKQSHSSGNVVHNSTELQTKLKEETCDSTKSEREEDVSSFNEAEKNKNEQEEVFFEASDEIHCKINRGIKESKERKLKQYEDKNKKVVSSESLNDESSNISDTQQEILSETDLPIHSKGKTQSKDDTSIHNESVPETSNETENLKQCVTNGEVEKKHIGHCGISLDARKDKEVNRNNNHPMEEEHGLNSACGCGDFAYTMNNSIMQNSSSQTNAIEPDENVASEQSDGGISLEYFEEVMERVIEQQINDSMGSYEGLDFSNDTEDESSCIESSDFSETDDCSMNDSMQDK